MGPSLEEGFQLFYDSPFYPEEAESHHINNTNQWGSETTIQSYSETIEKLSIFPGFFISLSYKSSAPLLYFNCNNAFQDLVLKYLTLQIPFLESACFNSLIHVL